MEDVEKILNGLVDVRDVDPDEIIPALLDASTPSDTSPDNGDVGDKSVLAIRALRIVLLAHRLRLSSAMRLCVTLFLSEFATTTDGQLLEAVSDCVAELVVGVIVSTTSSAVDDEETYKSLLEELTSLRCLVASTIGGTQRNATSPSAGSEDFTNENVFYAHQSIIRSLYHIADAAISAQSCLQNNSENTFLTSTIESCCCQLVSVLQATTNHLPVSCISAALQRVHMLLSRLSKLSLDGGPSWFLRCASITLSQLTSAVSLIAVTGNRTVASSGALRNASIVRIVRKLLSASRTDFPTLPKSAIHALNAAVEALGGTATTSASMASLPTATKGASPELSRVSVAEWNAKFRVPSQFVASITNGGGDQELEQHANAISAGETFEPQAKGHNGIEMVSEVPSEEPRYFSISEAVQAVFLSLQHMPIQVVVEQGYLEHLHKEGVRTSELQAAKRAQCEEIERLRRQEAQGIDEVAPAHLLQRTPGGGTAALKSTAQAFERVSFRSALAKRAFAAMLKNFVVLRQQQQQQSVSGSSLQQRSSGAVRNEASLRTIHALLARTLTQLPASVSDSATDALLELLEAEAREDRTNVKAPPSSVFALLLQTLFMRCAQCALVALQHSTTPAGASLSTVATSGLPTVDNPVGWLATGSLEVVDDTGAAPGGGKKRPREGEDANVLAGPNASMATDAPQSSSITLTITNDNAESVSSYSHLLKRVLMTFVDTNRADLVLETLVQAPVITPNVWTFLLQKLCLGEKLHAPIGVYALSHVANKRRVYRSHAISLLMFLAGSPKADPRRLAIAQFAKLMDASSVLTADMEQKLVQYAMKLVARVPLIRSAKMEPTNAPGDQQQQASEAAEKERLQTHAALDRQLGLLLMLCSRKAHAKSLFTSLLTTFEECRRRENTQVQNALLEHPDVLKLVQQLFKDPQEFILQVVPVLRRYPSGAEPLVQKILHVVSSELRQQIALVKLGGGGGQSAAIENLASTAQVLLSLAKSLFEASKLALSAMASGREVTTYIKDIRFMAPFLSLVPRKELKEQGYLESLAQFAGTDSFSDDAVRATLRECSVKSPLDFADGLPRGISPVELLVFFHELASMSPSVSSTAALTASSSVVNSVMLKSIVHACLKVSRTFDTSTAMPLYDVKDCIKALQQLIKLKPIPSVLMMTAMTMCRLHNEHPDIVFFVVSTVLTHLARDSMWDSDPQLWRGAMHFCDEHWGETQGFLFNLPDRVLLAALKEYPHMREEFRAVQSTNASFSHILAAL